MKEAKPIMVRNMPLDIWHDFKVKCAVLGVPINQRLVELVRQDVTQPPAKPMK